MPRNYEDWLGAYCAHTSHTEAPRRLHFWCGVSAIAGALRRHVWLNMGYFNWFTNHYIVLVAPAGLSKTTTSGLAMELLRKVPGVVFGPDSVTWPKLVQDFVTHTEMFEINGEYATQSALTLHASEFGNLFDPQDRALVDILVDLWDSKTGAFERGTKGDGSLVIENPWINLIACTTPSWIGAYFPENLIEGGFTSRCVFVYADKKERLVAYPHRHIPPDHLVTKQKLTEDLAYIAEKLLGVYTLTPDAETWGEAWYENHYANPPPKLKQGKFSSYLARKQTHLHKLAMILAASCRDELVITKQDLMDANVMLTDLESDMPLVFAKIGRSADALRAERLIDMVWSHPEGIPYNDLFAAVKDHFPDFKEYTAAVQAGMVASQIRTENLNGLLWVKPGKNR